MARLPLDKGKKARGKQIREIRFIEDKVARQVTFSKRKAGLWKKAAELAVLSRVNLAIVVFSEAGRAFAIGSPSADAVLGCADNAHAAAAAAAADDDKEWEDLEALFRKTEEKSAEVTAESKRMIAIGKKIVEVKEQTGKRFWWEIDPAALGKEELPEFIKALERIRANVGRHAEALSTQQ